MATVVQLQSMNHRTHFRAATLRDSAGLGVLDPVLGVDHAWISEPTFPPHPHAGFSAVSYVFADAETGLENQDSIGTRNLIRPGGLHWTAAGRGIVHEEVPAEPGKASHLFQIFINLPVAKQGDAPFALSLEPEDVPVVTFAEAEVRVPLGRLWETSSPLNTPTEINLYDIELRPGGRLEVPVAAGSNAFVLPVRGEVSVNGTSFSDQSPAIPTFPAQDQQQYLELAAPADTAQVVVFSGPPLRQPVFWMGPMAMASREALIKAAQAYERGELGTLKPF